MTQTLIIGAGPTGLSLAHKLHGRKRILEAEDRVGGLCRSVHAEGGTFDIGGHSFHTPHPDVDEFVHTILNGRVYSQTRDARVYAAGTLIPYPFQKFFDQIPDPDIVRECRAGLAQTRDAGQADNFEDYITMKFGDGIARHFMLPYNRKLWARDIRNISTEWTSERVAAPKGTPEVFDTRGGKRKPLQPGTRVAYPEEGGFEAIFQAIAAQLPAIEFNKRVVTIDPATKTAVTSDNTVYHWERLVSTMPLPLLLRCIPGVPRKLLELADQLEYMSLHVAFLLADSSLLHAPQRIYVADPAVPPHKIAFNHHSSEALRARPRHAIMAEVSFSEQKPVNHATIASETAAFLTRLGILKSPRDIIWHDHMIVKYAYPVYTHGRPRILRQIKDYLQQYNIHTVGRFGGWQYINSDKCIKQGFNLAHQLNTERETLRQTAAAG